MRRNPFSISILLGALCSSAAPYPLHNNIQMEAHPFVEAAAVNFEISSKDAVYISPQCLRNKGYELLLIDPGHDDSEDSRRSEAKKDRNSREKEFLRPRIHEGNLNQTVSWLLYEHFMKSPRLSLQQKQELETMLRFTRYPAELEFGTYEVDAGYSSTTQGAIDATTLNRVERVNFAMMNHRLYDPNERHGWSKEVSDVRSQTLFFSIHSNNSGGFYDDADYSWLVLDPESPLASTDYLVSLKIASAFEQVLPKFLEEKPWDAALDRILKFDTRDAFHISRTKIRPVDRPLKLMSRDVGTAETTKFLSEAFFMTGKVGHLVHRELESPDRQKFLQFYRKGTKISEYQVSDLYILYAKALAEGISKYLECE